MLRWGHDSGAPMRGSASLEEKEERAELAFSVTWGHDEKATVCKPGRGPSPGTQSASTLISDCPASRRGGENVCCLSHLVCGIMSDQPQPTNSYCLRLPRTMASADQSGTGKARASWYCCSGSVALFPVASMKPAHNFVNDYFPVTQLECAFPFLLGHSLTGVYFLSRD